MSHDEPDFLREVDAALDRPNPFAAVLALVQQRFETDSGTIHMLAVDGLLRLEAYVEGLPAAVLDSIKEVPVGKGMAGLAVSRGEPVTACNLQTDRTGDVRPGARQTDLRGSIVVPILLGDEAVGALGVANQAERSFSPGETALLLEVGRHIARMTPPDNRSSGRTP